MIVLVNEPALRAVRQATTTIPIVMVGYTDDPVTLGWIESYRRPGGNVTGIFNVNSALTGKRLEMLRETLPKVSRIAVLWDPAFGRRRLDELQRAAELLKVQLQPIEVRGPEGLEPAFKTARRNNIGAVMLLWSPVFYLNRARIAGLALEAALPTVTDLDIATEAGCLLSYGSDSYFPFDRAAYFVDRLLKGAKAADLPVEQISKLKLILNLKTAKALGSHHPRVDPAARRRGDTLMTIACHHQARVGGWMKGSVAAVLLLAVALLTSLGWTGESWGQTTLPRVGILSYGGTTDEAVKQWLEPFRRTLADQGWIEGKQVAFEYRRAVGDPSQLAEAAADLTRLKVDVIFADSAPAVRAAHAATSTIPIVAMDFTTDPVAEGYVESYGRPGRNITGVFLDAPEFAGKWLELLKAIVPDLSRVAVLWDPSPGPDAPARSPKCHSGVWPAAPSSRGQKAGGHRQGVLCVARSAAGPDHPAFADDLCAECTTRQTGDEAPAACDIDGATVCRCGRCHRLRARTGVGLRAYCCPRGQDPRRGQTGGASGRTTHKDPAHCQPEDRQGPRPDSPEFCFAQSG